MTPGEYDKASDNVCACICVYTCVYVWHVFMYVCSCIYSCMLHFHVCYGIFVHIVFVCMSFMHVVYLYVCVYVCDYVL